MKVIRRGVFETNSSSTHSISIVRDPFRVDRIPTSDGVCRIYPGEFGWEVEDYFDASTKASYCLTWCKQGNRESQLAMLEKVVAAETGCRVEFMNETDDEWCYIDHQSDDACCEAFESEDSLRNFIFNSVSRLHTDNDNK